MKLYIIRHAIAVEAGTPGYEEDNQRVLTEKGTKRMVKIAQGLKALEERMDLILTSPYLRAVQTANILRKVFKLKKDKVIETGHLAPMGYADHLVNEINEKYADVEMIALVGHEPSLSTLVSVLIAGEPDLSLSLKKGGVCRLSVGGLQYGRCASLDWLLSPSQLVELSE
jgi:phosphohistidine phosphatase